MTDDLGPNHDDHHVVDRLRALGSDPVEGPLATRHLTAMAGVRGRKRFGPLAVAAAAMVGFLVGGSGLAVAGALPGPTQDAAATVLARVGVDVPVTHGQCMRNLARSIGEDVPDRGERISAAARGESDECPKPGNRGRARFADDPCRGAPPWAGRDTEPTTEELDARREQCRGKRGRPEGAGREGMGNRPEGAGRQGQGMGNRREGDGCTGPPAWAGRGGGPADEQEEADHRARREHCERGRGGRDTDDEE